MLYKNNTTLLDKPVIFRTEIIKQAAIESGLVSKSDRVTIDRLLEAYKKLTKEYEMSCVILG